MRSMRAVIVAVIVAVCLLLLPAPALADGGGGFAVYTTKVSEIRPAVPGLTATAESNGQSMTVTNTSDVTVTVYGYQGEPYVRISSQGVWENKLSPAVYLNKEQTIGEFPKDANAEAPPQWQKISSAHRYTWHDHRIHWMGASEPPSVSKDPGHEHLINTWKVPYSTGAATAATGNIVGTLTYDPSSHLGKYLTWGAIVLALLIVISLQLFLRRRPPRERRPKNKPSEPSEPTTAV